MNNVKVDDSSYPKERKNSSLAVLGFTVSCFQFCSWLALIFSVRGWDWIKNSSGPNELVVLSCFLFFFSALISILALAKSVYRPERKKVLAVAGVLLSSTPLLLPLIFFLVASFIALLVDF